MSRSSVETVDEEEYTPYRYFHDSRINSSRVLTQRVDRKTITNLLDRSDFTETGSMDFSDITGGKPFSWKTHEASFTIPLFPTNSKQTFAMVAVSEQTPPVNKEVSLNTDNPFIVGRFSKHPVEQGAFEQDLRLLYDQLVYNPKKGLNEKYGKYAGGIEMIASLMGIGAGFFSFNTENTNFGWLVAPGTTGFILSIGQLTSADDAQTDREKNVLSAVQARKEYRAGDGIIGTIRSFRYTTNDVLLKRAVYEVVQKELGPINPKLFLQHYPYSNTVSNIRARKLAEQYEEHKIDPTTPLSPLFIGLSEINIGVLRVETNLHPPKSPS